MKKLSKRELIIFAVCLVTILIYVLYSIVIRPMQTAGNDLKSRIEEAELALEKTRNIIRTGSSVEIDYDHIKNKLGVSSSKGSEFSQIISKIESLAKDADIHVSNIQPQQAQTKTPLRIYPVEIDIEGTWPDIVKFLYLTQAQPNFFNVDELNLDKFSENINKLRGRIVLSRIRVIDSD